MAHLRVNSLGTRCPGLYASAGSMTAPIFCKWVSSAPVFFIYMSIAMRQKGVIMSQLFTTGRVITDLELKTSAQKNPYIHFTLMERVGYGDSAHAQFIHVWAWGHLAEQLKRFKVRRGSTIWVSGSLELEEFARKDGSGSDKQLKLKLNDWGFVPKDSDKPQKKETGPAASKDASRKTADVIDGEREPLPE